MSLLRLLTTRCS